MAPRAFGALFALVAAILLLGSLAGAVVPTIVPGWWDGHPRVAGKTIERKEIHVGLLGGQGCNLGETVKCEDLPTGSQLRPIGIAELAAIGVTIASLIALMISAWAVGDRRKWLAKLALGETILIAACGGVLLYLGPEIRSTQQVVVPLGLGMMMFWGGIGSASLAGVIVTRLEREPLRLRASAGAVPPPPQQPAWDVGELLRDDQLRLAVPSPGGHLAGPAGPLAPPPLFDAAPQLRPLYDLHNAGVVPSPRPPPVPDLPPPAVSRESLGAIADPPPPVAPRPPQTAPMPAPVVRAKAASLPPPLVRPTPPDRPARVTGAPSKYPTLAHAIPPPPTPANLTPPSVLPARDSAVRVPVDHDERATAVRDVADPITAVEIDAEAKAKAAADPRATDTDQSPVVPSPRDSMDLNATVERPRPSAPAITDEPRESAATIARPRVSAPAIDPPARASAPAIEPRGTSAPAIEPRRASAPAIADEPRESAATIARPRVSAPAIADEPADTAATTARPRVSQPAIEPRDSAATVARPRVSAPAIDPAPAAEATRASQVPISTAPASLPPPRKTTQAAGPTPACPQCEAPMAWVDEHLRFYCPQCRMYF